MFGIPLSKSYQDRNHLLLLLVRHCAEGTHGSFDIRHVFQLVSLEGGQYSKSFIPKLTDCNNANFIQKSSPLNGVRVEKFISLAFDFESF
jgi:hypothetical protein